MIRTAAIQCGSEVSGVSGRLTMPSMQKKDDLMRAWKASKSRQTSKSTPKHSGFDGSRKWVNTYPAPLSQPSANPVAKSSPRSNTSQQPQQHVSPAVKVKPAQPQQQVKPASPEPEQQQPSKFLNCFLTTTASSHTVVSYNSSHTQRLLQPRFSSSNGSQIAQAL